MNLQEHAEWLYEAPERHVLVVPTESDRSAFIRSFGVHYTQVYSMWAITTEYYTDLENKEVRFVDTARALSTLLPGTTLVEKVLS